MNGIGDAAPMGEKGTGDAAPMALIFAEREWRLRENGGRKERRFQFYL
jgi:hypothetical protein